MSRTLRPKPQNRLMFENDDYCLKRIPLQILLLLLLLLTFISVSMYLAKNKLIGDTYSKNYTFPKTIILKLLKNKLFLTLPNYRY